MTEQQLLTSKQMAQFAARGFLQMDSVVPADLNQAFLDEIGHPADGNVSSMKQHYGNIMRSSAIPVVAAGTSLVEAYPTDSALSSIIRLPRVSGAIESLVGENPTFDHHFLHISFPPALLPEPASAQHNHQDSTIDPRRAFDVQIMYYPHAVTADMGGTRFIPGTHLRIVSEAAIARYQNIAGQQHMVCPAGTLLFVHHGLWHGGGCNRSDSLRYMFKIRICPTQRQCRLWDTGDLEEDQNQRAIFWVDPNASRDDIPSILTRPEPWHEMDTGRLEYLNRARFWRYLTGDENYDVDYWLTRVENEYQ